MKACAGCGAQAQGPTAEGYRMTRNISHTVDREVWVRLNASSPHGGLVIVERERSIRDVKQWDETAVLVTREELAAIVAAVEANHG